MSRSAYRRTFASGVVAAVAAQMLLGCSSQVGRPEPVAVPEATDSPHRIVHDRPFRPLSLTREAVPRDLDPEAVRDDDSEARVSWEATDAAAGPLPLTIGYGGRRGVRGAQPQGRLATELVGLEVVAGDPVGVDVIVAGNGEFVWRAFRLADPERLVIDLEGVLHRASKLERRGTRAPLRLVRSAQFQREPSPVARIVLELDHPAEVAIEAGVGGLVVQVR